MYNLRLLIKRKRKKRKKKKEEEKWQNSSESYKEIMFCYKVNDFMSL